MCWHPRWRSPVYHPRPEKARATGDHDAPGSPISYLPLLKFVRCALLQSSHGCRPLVPANLVASVCAIAPMGLQAEAPYPRVDHDRNQLFERDLGSQPVPPGLGGICLKTATSMGRK